MILFNLSQTSVDESISYIDHLKERILVGVRLGMKDGVQGLRQAEVEAASAHPPDPRPEKDNDRLASILGRAGRVIETEDAIAAIYKPRNRGKQPHYWLEYGVNIPAVEDTLMAMKIGGDTDLRKAHKAFSIGAKPFFFATGEGYQAEFFERLKSRVEEALSA
jgi:hypothetical protein